MQSIADLQLHSRFSRAVSKEMTIPNIAAWAARKGIDLVATGDWTHPLWFREIQENLEETGNGLLRLRKQKLDNGNQKLVIEDRNLNLENKPISNFNQPISPFFLLATEVSSIYSQGGKLRRVHTLIWVPSLSSAGKISQEMTKRGCNLLSDGRPIVGLTCLEIAELVFTIEPKALIIPAHAWTPWFSVYGSLGGFDRLEEAFGPFAKYIYAVETGLSSNPAMNWRIKELDDRSIVSFSDAHSGPKIGREATVFEMPSGAVSYETVYQAIKCSPHAKIAYTLEFYPEEGKYHYTGHRACGIRWSPAETKQKGTTCPVCGKPLTQGVMQRIEELAGRSEEDLKLEAVTLPDVKATATGSNAFPHRPPFVMLVPLQEIIAEAVGSPVTSPKVQTPYRQLTEALGGEFTVLLRSDIKDIERVAGARIAAGVDKVRRGDIVIDPGYDGVFGVVRIWRDGEEKPLLDASREQLSIF
ncbi:endonuclease Q family protein [Patescibacteria group bacterium]|nr:endonuclease Q family protein [Patescibacteria group bacterium]